MPAADRTVVRGEPDTGPSRHSHRRPERDAVRILLDGNGADLGRLEDGWSLDTLTDQVYGVPKVQRGLAPADQIVKGDKELGAAQRAFFTLLYNLLIGKDTGPRLPTLLLAIGPERVRSAARPLSAVLRPSPGAREVSPRARRSWWWSSSHERSSWRCSGSSCDARGRGASCWGLRLSLAGSRPHGGRSTPDVDRVSGDLTVGEGGLARPSMSSRSSRTIRQDAGRHGIP